MKNKQKSFVSLIIIIAILVIGGAGLYFYKNQKNIIYKKSVVIEEKDLSKVSSCTSSTGKVMTYGRALEIAKASSCANVGNFTGEYGCNDNSGGMINVMMDPINHPSCGFACRVSIDKEVANEGWMCMGLIPATKK